MSTAMDTVLDAMSTVTSLVSEIFTMITSNPVLVVFLAASLLGIGITVFQNLKSSVQ